MSAQAYASHKPVTQPEAPVYATAEHAAVHPGAPSRSHYAATMPPLAPPEHDFSRVPLQPKLRVNRPGDLFEREADRLAESVSDGFAPSSGSGAGLEQPNGSPIDFRGVMSSPGRPLDTNTRAFMEPRFGHDFGHVRIHTGASAATSARAVNALAYTSGSHVVFDSGLYEPHTASGRYLLAHELAHVAQQDAGRVVGGPIIQRYTRYSPQDQERLRSRGWRHPDRRELMVADSGEMAVEYRPWHSKKAWARSSMIADSNRTLEGQGSAIRLAAGTERIMGGAPRGSSSGTIELNEVEVRDPGGGPGTLAGDCGSACLMTMGAAARKEFVGVTRPGGTPAFTPPVGYRGGWGPGSNTTTSELSGYIFQTMMKNEFGRDLDPQAAREAYARLPAGERDRLDRKYGLNRFAVPEVGQGMTTGTEFDMPGFRSDAEQAQRRNTLWGGLGGLGGGALVGGLIGLAAGGPLGLLAGALVGGLLGGLLGMGIGSSIDTSDENTWNFHFATAIFRSGHDYVTIENVAGRSPDDWLFMMYGPADSNQSFHDFQGRAEHGNRYTSMVVQNPDLVP